MTQQKESIERRINGLARRVTLLSAVRHAVPPSQVWIRAGIIAAGLAAGIPGAGAAPFPPVFPLANLIPPAAETAVKASCSEESANLTCPETR
jgi:hypothetical protein